MDRTVPVLLTLLFLASCSKSNNLLLGRVQSAVGSHTVVVTDCYRTTITAVTTTAAADRAVAFRWRPCRDADITIAGDRLIVNATSYGTIRPHDAVTVDHGRVLVNDLPAVAR